MIDLHSHILYGFDDGARSLEDSLELARVAASGGTTVIAATPHSPGSTACRVYDPALVRERASELNAALKAQNLAVEVVAGTEIIFDGAIVERLRRGVLLPYGQSRAILLEPTFSSFPVAFDNILFSIQAAGYRVVLAHPERVADVQNNPNVLIPLIERGVLMQLTAEALTGEQGERMRRIAEALVSHQMIHVIASDTHGPTFRPPRLGPARARAAALLGDAADTLVRAIPQAILEDRPIIPATPRPVDRRFPRRGW